MSYRALDAADLLPAEIGYVFRGLGYLWFT